MGAKKKNSDLHTLTLFANPLAEIYKKPVQATQMVVKNGQITGQQLKAWNVLLKNAKEQKDLFAMQSPNTEARNRTYRISRKNLMEKMGYANTNRKPFKEALTKMQNLTAQWDVLRADGNNVWTSCVLLPFVSIDNDYVHYSFVEQIEPMLFESTLYSKLNMDIQRSLRLDPSIRLYDWISRYRSNPGKLTAVHPWEFWRTVIHGEVDENSYLNTYKLFKRDKILPAIKEINDASDLLIELIEDKNGTRKVQKLQFKVVEKPKLEGQPATDTSPDKEFNIKEELKELDISNHYYKKLVEKYDDNRIYSNILYLKDRLKDPNMDPVKSKGAYLLQACEYNYAGIQEKKNATKEPAPKGVSPAEILSLIKRAKVDDAIKMFNEMDMSTRNELIQKYNDQTDVSVSRIPANESDRMNIHMMPFYSWLAHETWGEPTAEEIIDFTLKFP